MNTRHIKALSQSNSIFNISEDLQVNVNVARNPYNIPLDILFSMALRNNKKRRFLFVSKILGKHIPASPYVPLLGGAALGLHFLRELYGISTPQISDIIDALVRGSNYRDSYINFKELSVNLPEKTIFIGFAETATALGHSVFDCFQDNCFYIHTTRELVRELEVPVRFEEEHSHATSHRLYPLKGSLPDDCKQIVLIDDEITTGKTALNIIEAMQKVYPVNRYVVASLLDWRSDEDKMRCSLLENKLGVEIRHVSLVSGTIDMLDHQGDAVKSLLQQTDEFFPENSKIQYIDLSSFFIEKINLSSENSVGEMNESPYLAATGRFGIDAAGNRTGYNAAKKAGDYLRGIIAGERILCLGTGEFMFLPLLISAFMNETANFHSTTRSPIFPGNSENYGIRNAFSFESPEDPAVTNYLYNIPYGFYDGVCLFLERKVRKERLEQVLGVLNSRGIPGIYVASFS